MSSKMIFAPQSSPEIFALTISTLKLVLGLGSKKEPKKVPAEKQKRVELPQSGKQTGGATVVASITKVKKVVKKKE